MKTIIRITCAYLTIFGLFRDVVGGVDSQV